MPKITKLKAKKYARYIMKKGIDPCTHKKIRFYCNYCDTEYVRNNISYITYSKNDTICYSCHAFTKRGEYYRRLHERINDTYLRKNSIVSDKIIDEAFERAEWFGEGFYQQHFLN